MVFESLEEYPPTEKRYLERLNIDIHPVSVPRPSSQTVGDESREQSIEIEQEKDCSVKSQQGKGIRGGSTYRIPQMSSSIRKILGLDKFWTFTLQTGSHPHQLKLGFSPRGLDVSPPLPDIVSIPTLWHRVAHIAHVSNGMAIGRSFRSTDPITVRQDYSKKHLESDQMQSAHAAAVEERLIEFDSARDRHCQKNNHADTRPRLADLLNQVDLTLQVASRPQLSLSTIL